MTSINQGFNFQPSNTPNTKLYICSVDRKTGETETNFTVALNGAQLDQTRSLAVHSVNIPNMFKNVEINNNGFTFELSTAVVFLNAIDPGNYTILELAQEMVDKMNANIGGPEIVSFTYNSATGLVTFSMTGPRTFRFNFNVFNQDVGQAIVEDKLKLSTGGAFAASHTSNTPINLFPRIKQVFVDLDIVFGNYDTPATGQQDFVIGLPVVTPFGSFLVYKEDGDNNMHINFPNSKNITYIRVRLVDKDNVEVADLVGFDWDITLVADTFELP